MYNAKELKIKYEGDGKLPKRKKNKNPDPISELGYSDHSPFRDYPYHIITSPGGYITMENTGIPILANGHYLPPYSGTYKFDTDKILEIPLARKGGNISSAKAKEMLKNPPHGKALTKKQEHYFQAIAHGWKPSKQYGGWLDKYQDGGSAVRSTTTVDVPINSYDLKIFDPGTYSLNEEADQFNDYVTYLRHKYNVSNPVEIPFEIPGYRATLLFNTPYYHLPKNISPKNKKLYENGIAFQEIPHAIQNKEQGQFNIGLKTIYDLIRYSKEDRYYNKPDAIEYQAHKIIGPKLYKELRELEWQTPTDKEIKEKYFKQYGGWLDKYQGGGPSDEQSLTADELYREYRKEQELVNDAIKGTTIYKNKPEEVAAKYESVIPSKLPFVPKDCKGFWCATAATAQLADTFYDAPPPTTGGDTFMSSIWSGKYPNYTTTDKIYKNVSPGSIIQFMDNRIDKKTGQIIPNKFQSGHNMYIVSVKDIGDGKKEILTSQSPGGDHIIKAKYTVTPDNRIYREDGSEITTYPYKIMAMRKQQWPSTEKRDRLASKIKELYPEMFGAVRHDKDFRPDYMGLTSSTVIPKFSDKDKDNPELIGLNDAKLKDIVAQIGDPEYKKKIMKDYNLSNQEYNEVAKTMIGMYGVESQFNTEYLSKLKSGNLRGLFEPKLTNYLVPEYYNTSRGPFQLNYNTLSKQTKRLIPKDEWVNTSWDPVKASDIAMRYLAENVSTLRKRAEKGTKTNLTKENYLDYLGYIPNSQELLTGEGDVVPPSRYNEQVNYYKNLLEVLPSSISLPVEIPGYKQMGGWLDKYQTEGNVESRYPMPTKFVPRFNEQQRLAEEYMTKRTGKSQVDRMKAAGVNPLTGNPMATGKVESVPIELAFMPALRAIEGAGAAVGRTALAQGTKAAVKKVITNPLINGAFALEAYSRQPEEVNNIADLLTHPEQHTWPEYVLQGINTAFDFSIMKGGKSLLSRISVNPANSSISTIDDIVKKGIKEAIKYPGMLYKPNYKYLNEKNLNEFLADKFEPPNFGGMNSGFNYLKPNPWWSMVNKKPNTYLVKHEDPRNVGYYISGYEDLNVPELYRNINNPRVIKPLAQVDYKIPNPIKIKGIPEAKRRALVMKFAKGKHIEDLSLDELADIQPEHINTFYKDLNRLKEQGIVFDKIGTNVLWNKKKGFQIIDTMPLRPIETQTQQQWLDDILMEHPTEDVVKEYFKHRLPFEKDIDNLPFKQGGQNNWLDKYK